MGSGVGKKLIKGRRGGETRSKEFRRLDYNGLIIGDLGVKLKTWGEGAGLF